jgi:hypothetical protein
MKLTIDKVRVLREHHHEELCAQHDAERPEDCSLCGLHAIGVALCDEWIAVRTVRWVSLLPHSAHEPLMVEGAEFGSANYLPDGTWEATLDGVHQCLFTERDRCKEYLENVARDRGYEVAT